MNAVRAQRIRGYARRGHSAVRQLIESVLVPQCSVCGYHQSPPANRWVFRGVCDRCRSQGKGP